MVAVHAELNQMHMVIDMCSLNGLLQRSAERQVNVEAVPAGRPTWWFGSCGQLVVEWIAFLESLMSQQAQLLSLRFRFAIPSRGCPEQ